jgi:hypothetical protein
MGVVKQQHIYLDSCIVIYLIEDHPVYKSPIEQALIQYIDSEFCGLPSRQNGMPGRPFTPQ